MKLNATERVLLAGILLDILISIPLVLFGFMSGAATAMAEAIRGVLLTSIDIFSLAVMLAINRHRFSRFEFGLEKIEILVQIVIALSMTLSLVFVGDRILSRMLEPGVQPSYLFSLVFASVCYVNLTINFTMFRAQRRALRLRPSLILRGQVKNRLIMLVGSAVATLASFAVVIPDRTVFTYIDIFGALVAFAVIAYTVVRLLRGGILSLIDAPIDETEKLGIYRKVVEHYEDWDELVYLRTRRIGHQSYVEIGLAFDPERPLDSALKSCRQIEEAVRGAMQNVFVSVRPAAAVRIAG